MLDFGANPVERQLIMSAQFLRAELPIRLAHRVAELENLPYGLSAKPHVLKVLDSTGSDAINIVEVAAYVML
jgi:pyruvate dehydrogenase kinase 2/3/4